MWRIEHQAMTIKRFWDSGLDGIRTCGKRKVGNLALRVREGMTEWRRGHMQVQHRMTGLGIMVEISLLSTIHASSSFKYKQESPFVNHQSTPRQDLADPTLLVLPHSREIMLDQDIRIFVILSLDHCKCSFRKHKHVLYPHCGFQVPEFLEL